MDILVVYYSRSGVTRTVAEKIAEMLAATVEELVDTKNRKGLLGFLGAVRDATRKKVVPIEPPTNNPADYDVVIIGTPVWANTVSSPVRTYLREHGEQIRRAGLFCTSHSCGLDRTLQAMAEMCGGEVVAQMGLRQKAVRKGQYTDRLDAFVRTIQAAHDS